MSLGPSHFLGPLTLWTQEGGFRDKVLNILLLHQNETRISPCIFKVDKWSFFANSRINYSMLRMLMFRQWKNVLFSSSSSSRKDEQFYSKAKYLTEAVSLIQFNKQFTVTLHVYVLQQDHRPNWGWWRRGGTERTQGVTNSDEFFTKTGS